MNDRVDWLRWNRRLLALFGPLLIAAGLLGLLIPQRYSALSGAAPYDVFHIAFGLFGAWTALVRRSSSGSAAFNFGFGLVDLYQAVARPAGIFPAQLFELRAADEVVHIVIGALLVLVGAGGLLAQRRQAGAKAG